MTLFKLNTFNIIRYTPGAHVVSVKLENGINAKSLNGKEIKSFHLKYIDKNYCLERKHLAKNRRGQNDIKMGYGKQYTKSDNEFISEFDKMVKNRVKIKDYLDGKIIGDNASKNIRFISVEHGTINSVIAIYGDINNVTKRSKFRRSVVRKNRN